AMLGWVENRNLRIDYRFSDGDPGRLAAYAEELVNLRPDVIFAYTGPAIRAAQQRSSTIPVVFVGGGDPAPLRGGAAQLAGNVTGFANAFGSLGGKWLELFKEAVPRLTRVAHVFSENQFTTTQGGPLRASVSEGGARLGVTIVSMPVRSLGEIEPAIN